MVRICIICLEECINIRTACPGDCTTSICNNCYSIELHRKWIKNIDDRDYIDHGSFSCSYKCYEKWTYKFHDTFSHIDYDFKHQIMYRIQDKMINEYRNDALIPMLNLYLINDLSKMIIEFYKCKIDNFFHLFCYLLMGNMVYICIICLKSCKPRIKCSSKCSASLCYDCYSKELHMKWIEMIHADSEFVNGNYSCSYKCYEEWIFEWYSTLIIGFSEFKRQKFYYIQDRIIKEYENKMIIPILVDHLVVDLSKIVIEFI